MECTVRWTSGMTFLAETASNHVVAMDGAPEGGGRNLAPRPMEMVLVGTGGCTAYDVVVILKKSGQQVTGCEVKLTSERAETDPKVFTRIHMHFVLRGRGLKRNLVEQGMDPAGGSPEEFGTLIRADMDKWGDVGKRLGVKLD